MATPLRLSEFLPYVTPYAPGVPDPVAEASIRQAAIEFCKRTRCWREVRKVSVTDQNTVTVPAPYFASIHVIEYASFISADGARRRLDAIAYDELADMPDHYLTRAGVPERFTQSEPNMVRFFPIMPGDLEFSTILTPRLGQDFQAGDANDPVQDAFNTVPQFLFTRFGEEISHGALSRLLMQPQTRWHDPQSGMLYMQKFERACDENFAAGISGQQQTRLRTRPRYL